MDDKNDQERSLWVDVSTLANWRGNATGIARTLGQMVRHWLAEERLPLRLCRYDSIHKVYVPVDPAVIAPPRPTPPPRSEPRPVLWQARPGPLVPGEVGEICWHLGQAARCAGRLARAGLRRAWRMGQQTIARMSRPRPTAAFASGDVLFVGGISWKDGPGATLLGTLRQTVGLRVAHIVYDITPLRYPYLCDPNLTRAVATWLPGVLANADLVLTISEHSRRDLLDYGRQQGLTVPAIEMVRLGDEPGAEDSEAPPQELLTAAPGPFVLYVSTIGLNKNQGLLYQVWRRLIDRHGGGVPTLVLVGQPGWRAELLLRELHADPVLSRHVLHLAKANDAQLRWLYRRCLFTLYPSHYEGWGLPVAESLAHGKFCISSNAASLPEVGGDLVDYHDPLDGLTCQQLIEKALLEPGWLASREERIRREHRITTWENCAKQTWEILDRHFCLSPIPLRRAA
jgi:hypothetical protein